MSYMKQGISFSGLGEVMTVNLRTGDERVRSLQTELARLGFLESDTTSAGIDGKWGPRTETGLRNAARYVRYTSQPFTRSGSTVTVPDELISMLRSASPAPSGTEGRVPSAALAPPRTTDEVTRPPASDADRVPPPPVEESWMDSQILGVRAPVFVAGGVGLLLLVGAGVYFASTADSSKRAVAANRRRRRR